MLDKKSCSICEATYVGAHEFQCIYFIEKPGQCARIVLVSACLDDCNLPVKLTELYC